MDRHGLRPRDDKGGIFTMKGVKRLRFPFCHCEEDDGPTRQSIVSPWMWRYAVDSPITGSEMMARGLDRRGEGGNC